MNGDQRSVCALLSESDHVNAFAKKHHGKRQISDTKIAADSLEAAEDAGLRYVSDDQPGTSGQRNGEEFEYLDQKGKPIRDEQRLLRIKRLAIPPAWSDVWICPSPMDTSKPLDEMPGDGNNIDITSAGGKYAMRTNTIDWSTSEKPFRKFADG